MNLCLRLFSLECLLNWALLSGVKALLGSSLDGDKLMKLETDIMGQWILFQSPEMLPPEMQAKISLRYKVYGLVFAMIWSLSIIEKLH